MHIRHNVDNWEENPSSQVLKREEPSEEPTTRQEQTFRGNVTHVCRSLTCLAGLNDEETLKKTMDFRKQK